MKENKIMRGYETVTPEKAQKWLGTSGRKGIARLEKAERKGAAK